MTAKFSDIIPPSKRSIRNVPLNISVENEPTHVKKKTLEKDTRELMKIVRKEEQKVKSKMIWGVATFCVLILALIIVSKFATSTVSIVTSNKSIPISIDLDLSHDGTSTNSVDYDILKMSLSDNLPDSAVVTATGTLAQGSKASGTVIIYNNYSKSSQILIKNTRLESPDGKIFFLTDKVTIPGQTTLKGILTPGSVLAKIIAEKSGADYNVGIKDFIFPGLKSSPKYKTIYAKTKIAIDGGAGPKSKIIVDPSALDSIHTKLLDQANNQIKAQKSDDYLIIPGGTQESINLDGTSTAILNISVLLIKKSDLATEIQTSKNLDINLSPENTKNILIDTTNLKLSLPEGVKLNNISNGSVIRASLLGTTTISSDLSDVVLKKELAGMVYDNAVKLLKNKIGVEAVNLEIWPWWVKTVPSNQNRINIKIENN